LVDAGGLEHWNKNRDSYPLLYQFAQDLLSAPASEACEKWVFSIYAATFVLAREIAP